MITRPWTRSSSLSKLGVDILASQGLHTGRTGKCGATLRTDPAEFSVGLMSSAALANGNTLICDGVSGKIFEVTPDRTIVWQQRSPNVTASDLHTSKQRLDRHAATSAQNGFLPLALRDEIGTSSKQNKELDEFQNAVDQRLDTILTDEQRRHLREMNAAEPGGLGGFTAPGQIISLSRAIALKPTGEQKKQLAELQAGVDNELDKVLTVDQKARFAGIKHAFDRGGSVAISHRTTFGPTSDPLRAVTSGTSGTSGIASPLPPGVNPLFRALRYDAHYAGLADKHLRPAG